MSNIHSPGTYLLLNEHRYRGRISTEKGSPGIDNIGHSASRQTERHQILRLWQAKERDNVTGSAARYDGGLYSAIK